MLEGAVAVGTLDGRAHDLVTPGAIAIVSATNRFRMTVEDNGHTRVIESPGANDAPAAAGPVAAGGSTVATDVASAATAPDVPVEAAITTAVYPARVLACLTLTSSITERVSVSR